MRFFVTGTDTEIGKTVVSAWLMLHLGAAYWKPVQSGLEDETDAEAVKRLSGAGDERIHPSAYMLPEPLSPHESARRAGVEIEMDRFALPPGDGPLIVEGAGGLLVPLNEGALMIDLIARLGLPAILACRSTLGTINHTLLSIEALRARGLPLVGAVLVGPPTPHNRAAIEDYGQVRVIAEIPPLAPLDRQALEGIRPEIDLGRIEAR
ncbi:MAG: dethiobiotin synthase [Hyphomicrobiales bacterium]|nr:dethiobiotin synthase [Hyphomicrobiales bacterium]